MCARYSITTAPEAMRRLFNFTGPPPNLAARYNVAPTQEVPVVRNGAEGRTFALMRWGLIPAHIRDVAGLAVLINARAETVDRRSAFAPAFRARRCLVPADGFFEWRTEDGAKQPYWFHFDERAPFAFAGLWEHRQTAGGAAQLSVAIVVTAANDVVAPIHDRMPVILRAPDFAPWLDGASGDDALRALMRPYAGSDLRVLRVNRRVSAVANDDAACLAPAPPRVETPRLL